MAAKKYDVLSPDGFSITGVETYRSKKKAREAFEEWKKRYQSQGYYSWRGVRIPLEELADHCSLVTL